MRCHTRIVQVKYILRCFSIDACDTRSGLGGGRINIMCDRKTRKTQKKNTKKIISTRVTSKSKINSTTTNKFAVKSHVLSPRTRDADAKTHRERTEAADWLSVSPLVTGVTLNHLDFEQSEFG